MPLIVVIDDDAGTRMLVTQVLKKEGHEVMESARDEADRILKERVVPTVHRPEDMLRDRLPIGPPDLFAEKLTAFAKAGVQRVFIWPVANELHQLERFWNDVRPLVAAA